MNAYSAAFCLVVAISQLAVAQGGTVKPPGLAEAERQTHKAEQDNDMRPREQTSAGVKAVEMRRDAKQLLDLAQTIPQDVDLTLNGVLPKDLTNRLKRIEKLAKSLRANVDSASYR